MKQFHVFSDGKTVKELSWKDYLKISRRFMSGWIDDYGIMFSKGNSTIFISLEQLRKILELNKEEAKP